MSGDLPPDVDKCSDLPDDVSTMSCPSTPGTPASIPDMPPTPPRKRARRQAAKSSPRDSSSAGKFFTPRLVGHQLALLELFSGVGALSKAARQHGWEVKKVDIVNGAEFDLTRTQLQESLLDMIRSRCFTWVHLGPPMYNLVKLVLSFEPQQYQDENETCWVGLISCRGAWQPNG